LHIPGTVVRSEAQEGNEKGGRGGDKGKRGRLRRIENAGINRKLIKQKKRGSVVRTET